jgi:hypothetical protein
MSETLLADAYVGYPEELAMFEKPIQNVGIKRCHCTKYYPVNDFSNQGVIQFSVQNNSSSYIDLKKTLLNVTCKIVARNGDIVKPPVGGIKAAATSAPANDAAAAESNEDDDTTTATEQGVKRGIVGVVNNFMHSMFSRVDVALQNKVLTHADQAYPYLAYMKALLYTPKEQQDTALQTQMYFRDMPPNLHDNNWLYGDNAALKTRSKFFENSKEVDMSGHLYSDVLDINRFIPYGIPLNVTL